MEQSILKSITYNVLNWIIVTMCGLWLVNGIDGVGNVYVAWISFTSLVMTFAFVCVMSGVEVPKNKPKSRWWVKINSALCLIAQFGLLIWYGHGWYALMLFATCVEVWMIGEVLKGE